MIFEWPNRGIDIKALVTIELDIIFDIELVVIVDVTLCSLSFEHTSIVVSAVLGGVPAPEPCGTP